MKLIKLPSISHLFFLCFFIARRVFFPRDADNAKINHILQLICKLTVKKEDVVIVALDRRPMTQSPKLKSKDRFGDAKKEEQEWPGE